MRACPVCGRLYPLEAAFCQADGHRLGPVSQVPQRSDSDDPRVGQLLLDRYLVFRVVADGGTGRVYEALDQRAQRQVALKVLHPEVASEAVSVERFKREYEVSARLSHEHIVEVIDFRQTRDRSYVLVMEFLVGEELRATLRRDKSLSPARVVRLVSQLAKGLDAAHGRGFVHRDLKPDNVFLCQTRDGDVVKVFDFGSVKDRTASKQLTVTGTTIGSPYYMSPEQAQALSSLDHRADVWAVSVMLYEALSGSLPFQGTNAPSILLDILSKIPEPLSKPAAVLGITVPVEVDAAILAGLDKNPEHRTASVGELADALGAAFGLPGNHREWAETPERQLVRLIKQAGGSGVDAPADVSEHFFRTAAASETSSPPPSRRRSLWPWFLGAVGVVLVVLLYVFW